MNLAVLVGQRLDAEIEATRLYPHFERRTVASSAWFHLYQAKAWRNLSNVLVVPERKRECRERMREEAVRFRECAGRL